MNSSYKITLLVTIVLCGIILGYYITREDHSATPVVEPGSDVALKTDASPDTGTGMDNARLVPPPPTSGSSSLMDSVNAHSQSSQTDLLAPPPAASVPATGNPAPADASPAPLNNSNAGNATNPLLDARSVTPAPSPAPSIRNTPPAATSIPDTGRAALRSPAPATGRTYTVKSGDTLSSIAQQTLGSESKWNAIAEANPYLDPRKLKVGQVIRLPEPGNDSASHAASSGTSSTPANGASHVPAGPLEYVVREGDTLSKIAKTHYADPNLWDVIYRANKQLIGQDPAGIRPGMKLFIPPAPRIAQ